MSYGHADKINAQTGKTRGQPGQAVPVDPALWDQPEMRPVLGTRDISTLYQVLTKAGLSQHQIAKLTGQTQSEVCEILKGRRVIAYDVHRRIADGLGIPPGRMGLAYDAGYEPGQDLGKEAPQRKETPEEMRRRILMGATSLVALGRVVQGPGGGLGELTELALPTAQPLPSRLSMAHVHTVQAVTAQLRDLARRFGGQAGLFVVAAEYYSRWLSVPASEVIRTGLCAALAELHTEAGWSCYDSGVDGAGFFTRALALADEAGDGFGIANAAWHIGTTLVRSGHPDDGLKEFQLGQLTLDGFQPGKAKPAMLQADDPRLPTLTARLNRQSATAYALMDSPDQAQRHLAKAHDGWAPRNAYDQGAMDSATACVHLTLHRIDTAHQFVTSAVRAFGDGFGRERMRAELLLAEVSVRAGEPRGLVLAQQAIEAISTLQSVAVRQERLVPLVAALDAHPGSDAKELARTARQVAAFRA